MVSENLSVCLSVCLFITGFSLVSPTKVKALKSFFHFTEKFPCIVLSAQACNIDILFMDWMTPLWIPFETNIHCYSTEKLVTYTYQLYDIRIKYCFIKNWSFNIIIFEQNSAPTSKSKLTSTFFRMNWKRTFKKRSTKFCPN